MAKNPREWSPRGEKYEPRPLEDWGAEITCEIPERIRLTLLWADEGLNGDYEGPPDVPVLRVDVWDLRESDPKEDSATYSYATALPAWLPEVVLRSVCETMAADVEREDSYKRRIEEWTWTNEERAWEIYKSVRKEKKKRPGRKKS